MSPLYLFRFIRHLHRHDKVIAFAQTLPGQFVLWLVASFLLLPYDRTLAALVSPLLALVLIFPAKRNLILSLGGLLAFYNFVARRQMAHPATLGMAGLPPVLMTLTLGGGLLYLCYLAAKSYRRLPTAVQRYPQVPLHLLVWSAPALTWFIPHDGDLGAATLWLTMSTFPFLVWRCGYMLLAGRRGRAMSSSFQDHFFYLWPVYGGTNVPYGKGYDYLSQNAPESPEDYARAQLAGVKLLGLAWIWKAVDAFIGAAAYGESRKVVTSLLNGPGLGIPRLGALIWSYPNTGTSPGVAWVSLLLELINQTLMWAIFGHMIVGCLRLFGFNVFRNTYKPLLSESVVEFWNRFYYYFKELLVEFFFFPTYLSFFKKRPKIRLFAATMAAAFLGNLYYHILRDLRMLTRAGVIGAWSLLAPRVFYSLHLALGVYVSLLRQQKRRGTTQAKGTPLAYLRRLRRIAGVWLFYAIIHIWNAYPRELTFTQRTSFFFSLFGLQ